MLHVVCGACTGLGSLSPGLSLEEIHACGCEEFLPKWLLHRIPRRSSTWAGMPSGKQSLVTSIFVYAWSCSQLHYFYWFGCIGVKKKQKGQHSIGLNSIQLSLIFCCTASFCQGWGAHRISWGSFKDECAWLHLESLVTIFLY